MLWNYIKISLRNIRRYKLFSAINIISLTLSITICLAAMMIIKNQLDFDKFHPHLERTYRLITEITYENDSSRRFATTPLPLAERLRENHAFIEEISRLHQFSSSAAVNDKSWSFRSSFAEPSFFRVFGYDLENGNPQTALSEPYSMVLTRQAAKWFFGDQNPVGETVSVEGVGDFTVTGVLDRDLSDTHLEFYFLASFSTLSLMEDGSSLRNRLESWQTQYGSSYTYLLLKDDASRERMNDVLNAQSKQVSQTYELEDHVSQYTFEAQPMAAISPGEPLMHDIGGGKIHAMWDLVTMAVIALVILLMACFNYTNLSIARALKRAREVGIYKVLGASRRQVVSQFVIQATIVAAGSLLLAYAILPLVPLPPGLMEEVQAISPDMGLIVWFILFTLFTGFLDGVVPALMISSHSPVKMLGNSKNLKLISGLSLRKTLVVAQFSLSMILIVAATVTFQQSQYMATTNYGFRTDNIVNLDLKDVEPERVQDQIAGIAGVEQISALSDPFGFFSSGDLQVRRDRSQEPIRTHFYSADRNAVPNLELELVAGSNFPGSVSGRTESHILVNEQFVTIMGWDSPAEAVGESVWLNDSTQVQIAGVLENFHYRTLSFAINPMMLRHRPELNDHLNIRLADATDWEAFSSTMDSILEAAAPETNLFYHTYEEELYASHGQKDLVVAFGFYALIALAIASLGLLGMVTYTVEVRTQEVGIRKVLGAGISNLLGLLSREFIWLLIIAAGVGLPVGYWIGQQFLNNFAYHVSIGFSTLFLGIVIMGGLGLLVTGTQTWQVARKNPVEAIRTE